MKTSNKILLGGLIVVLTGILILLFIIKFNHRALPFELSGNTVVKEVPVARINNISVSDRMKVILDTTLTDKVIIKTDSSLVEYIKVIQMNNNLSLYSSIKYPKQTRVIVRVPADSITAIEADGGSIVESQKIIDEIKFGLTLDGGAQSHLNLDVENLRLSIHAGSSASLWGMSENAIIDFSEGARLNAKDLNMVNAMISGSNGAIAHITVTGALDVDINNGCVVKYSGEPKMRGSNVSSGARLVHKN